MRVAITGAATGIGAAVASKLKSEGAEIVAFDVTRPANNVDRWVEVDLSDAAATETATASVEGPFDALINNAGLPPREGLNELILAVNYFGLVRITEALLDRLSPGASIVNTASRAGAMWRENLEQVKRLMALESQSSLAGFIEAETIDHVRAYDLSKEAVIVWSMGQCERLIERDLRVNTVSPAAVSTGILDDFKAAFGERAAKGIARAGRPGTAKEIAEAICFLAGPESRWIKGIDLSVDGGMTAMAMSDRLQLSG